MSGLQATQQGVDIVSRNIANASTPGYTRKVLVTQNQLVDGHSIGVAYSAAQREVDSFKQQQMWGATGQTVSSTTIANYLSRIDTAMGASNQGLSLDAQLADLTQALQSLATTPENPAIQSQVANEADDLARSLRETSDLVQQLRLEAENGMASAVQETNKLLKTVSDINDQIIQTGATGGSIADLEDQRDIAINRLAELMDISVVKRDDGAVSLFTGGGFALLDSEPATLTFDGRTTIDATSVYSTDPSKRTVGTISLVAGSTSVDLIAANAFRSGELGALVELRDQILPQAQAQLDEMASELILALSEETVAGTAATAGAATGFDVETSGLQSGNTINLSYTIGGTTTNVTIVKVEDPSILPLSNSATNNPNDTVIGIDWTQPMGDIVNDLNAALPGAVVASNPSGTLLRFVDDGAAGTSDINSLSATTTPSSVTNSGKGLPLFVDGSAQKTYTNSLDNGGQKLGIAQRIQINSAVKADASTLVVYNTSPATNIGDPARPLDLINRLTSSNRTYSASVGIGSSTSPYSGTLDGFARRLVDFQTSQARDAKNAVEADKIVSDTLQAQFNESTQVDIDKEMSDLLVLQTAYQANARIMTAVQELMEIMINIGR